MNLSASALPMVSQEFLDTLDKAFPRPEVRPGYNAEEAMFSAGQRAVVDWIFHHVPKRTVTGEVLNEQRARVRTGS